MGKVCNYFITELTSHLEELIQQVQETKELLYEIFMSDGVTKITPRSFLEV